MHKYASANFKVNKPALVSCSRTLGRKELFQVTQEGEIVPEACATLLSLEHFARQAVTLVQLDCWSSVSGVALPLSREGEPLHFPFFVGIDDEDINCDRCWRMMLRSYSRESRRRKARMTTRQTTPIQLPANMAFDVIRHDELMKPRYAISNAILREKGRFSNYRRRW